MSTPFRCILRRKEILAAAAFLRTRPGEAGGCRSIDAEWRPPLEAWSLFCPLEDLIVRAGPLTHLDSDELARLRSLQRLVLELDRVHSLGQISGVALNVNRVAHQQMTLSNLDPGHPHLGEVLFHVTYLRLRHDIPPCSRSLPVYSPFGHRRVALEPDRGSGKPGFFTGNHDDPCLCHEITLPVLFGVIADLCPRWNDHIFVDDRPPNPAASSDLHQVHDDRAIDLAKAVDANVTPDNRGPDHAPADDGPFGHDRVKGHPSPSLFIKDELCGRISVADGPNRPVPVVEIEGGVDGAQVHVRLVVGFDRSHIPPVALLLPFQGCWDPVCPEVVGVDPPLFSYEAGQDVTAKVLSTTNVCSFFLHRPEQQFCIEQVVSHRGERA